jgi:2'-5' RNA ligase
MKRLFSYLAFGYLILFSLPCSAADVLITLYVCKERKHQIYDDVVKNTGLGKKGPDNYHVTIAQVKDVDPSDAGNLKAFLTKKLKEKCRSYLIKKGKNKGEIGIPVGLKHAGRYLVGGRTHHKCPIVLYLSPSSHEKMKDINRHLSQQLGHFKGKKHYKFAADVSPENYIPHMTIADTAYINNADANRNDVISKLNRNLNKASGNKPESYRFKLRG